VESLNDTELTGFSTSFFVCKKNQIIRTHREKDFLFDLEFFCSETCYEYIYQIATKMKLLNCTLIAFLLILPTGCWWLEEDDCTKLSKEITIRIYSEIIDYSEDQSRGEHAYAIDFYKDHCGGGPSGQMSYLYKGLYQSDERWYVKNEGIGTWDITFKYEEDMLNVNLV